ncbi:MAG: hypothetical protein ACHQ4J_06060 [Candidatus Binatia bacterium]
MSRMTFAVGFIVIAVFGALGCGSDNITALSTATPMLTATPTPLPSVAGEENLFGSTAKGSGALTIEALSLIPAYFSACLGGSGATCDGGTVVYIGSDPGFKEADIDDPGRPLYALPDGVTLSLVVIAIDPALSLKFENGTTLSAAGQSLVLGTTPGIHDDLEWELDTPGGLPATGHNVTLKLTTTASGFTDSVEFTETVEASSGTAPS